MSSTSSSMGEINSSNSKLSLILPVLFYEYLALSIAKSLIPKMLLEKFGGHTYIVVGIVETIKGFLAFVSCPFFGKLSDSVGRKYCLLFTVVGSTLPVSILAFTSNIYVFCIMTAISGLFSATFPLTFAYISDCVHEKSKRAPAYGLALATFGLSYCLGPITGSYLAAQFGDRSVFIMSLILVIMNVVYIIAVLPETVQTVETRSAFRGLSDIGKAMEHLPTTWSVGETFRIFNKDPFMRTLAVIVFLYYSAVWALVSTLVVYVTRYLLFSPVQLGAFMSAYGLATMVSEALLVRLTVPLIGEIASMQVGLLAFALQCAMVAFASSPEMIAMSVLLSMFANLVYPSVSSLVSRIVSERGQGEALGALNGIKAITEGFGASFGFLMSVYETSPIPGAPYLLGTFLALFAFLTCFDLPHESPDFGFDHLHRRIADGGPEAKNGRRTNTVHSSEVESVSINQVLQLEEKQSLVA